MSQLLEILESCAMEIVMADPTDVAALGKIHTHLESAAERCGADGLANGERAARAAAELCVELIMGNASDGAAACQTISETVSALQAMLQAREHDQDPELVKLPAGLGLEGTGGAGGPAGMYDQEIFDEFLSTQDDVLESLEARVMAAEEEGAENEENFNSIKRIIHTWKGEAGVLGVDDIQRICHNAETAMEESDGAIQADALLALKDWMTERFAQLAGKRDEAPARTAEDVLALFKPSGTDGGADAAPASAEPPVEVQVAEPEPAPEPVAMVFEAPKKKKFSVQLDAEGDTSLIFDFVSEALEHLETAEVNLMNLEEDPEDAENINAIFRAFHTIKGVSGFLNLTNIATLAHEAENLLDQARKGDVVLNSGGIDLAFASIDWIKQMVHRVAEIIEQGGGELEAPPNTESLLRGLQQAVAGTLPDLPAPEVHAEGAKLGEILVEDKLATSEAVAEAMAEQEREPEKRLGEILVERGEVKPREVAQALREQRGAQGGSVKKAIGATVKIGTGRLDSLIDMVGEMVIAQSMISHEPKIQNLGDPKVERNLSHLVKITRELQELSMSMRMVPVRSTFQKMARLVRDLSRRAGKKIEFEIEGEDTELDRNVVEEIHDPLIHMVRNSVDHGVESPEERLRAGKPEAGRVKLSAYHMGGNIVIEIMDDGRGLSKERILAKARERGILSEGQELSDAEIYNLIFAPGFSTAEKVTDISGRGVGMDVVKRNIESLRGRVDISSTFGAGSVFSIRLPLTLAIIDGMVVTIGAERFIIPTISIMESLKPTAEMISTVENKGEMIMVRNDLLPLFRLYRLFEIKGAKTDLTEGLVVILEAEGQRCGLLVDNLIGQQQVVIKSLGEAFAGIDGISGGAIMGDGRVGLILDAQGLAKLAQR